MKGGWEQHSVNSEEDEDKVSGDGGVMCHRLTIKGLLGGNVVMLLLLCQSSCRGCQIHP